MADLRVPCRRKEVVVPSCLYPFVDSVDGKAYVLSKNYQVHVYFVMDRNANAVSGPGDGDLVFVQRYADGTSPFDRNLAEIIIGLHGVGIAALPLPDG
jgi:hypothetical protein